MTCKETIRLICDYLDGSLSPQAAKEVRQHIDRCQDCRMVSEAARKTLLLEFDVEAHSAA